MNTKEVVIVGAGPGGLSAAMLLAGAGFKVRVIEKQGFIGGRTSTIDTGDYRFDLGPTFFLYPKVLKEIYQSVGRDLHQSVDLRRLDPQYRILFGSGGKIDATPSVDNMSEEIRQIAPGDAEGFEVFLNENRQKLELFKPCLERPFEKLRDVLNPRMLSLLPFLRPHQSMDSYLKRFFKDPRIRLAFSFQSKYLGMSPFQCPSLFSILSFLEYEYGVFHPIGGCGAVTRDMARIATEMGVEIRLGEPVRRVLLDGRQARGVETDQGVYHADALVVNADFAKFMTDAVPDAARRRWKDSRLGKKQYSCSTFMMYLGIEGLEDLPHHTIYISGDYRQNLRDIENRHRLTRDTSLYVQNACVTDPSLAKDGHSSLYVLAPVTHQHSNVNWETEREGFRARVYQQMEKLGYHGIEKRVRYEKIVTPRDWEENYSIYRGATFNLAHNIRQLLHLRPRNRFEDLDGVYLVGGGTHPGSGLPVIFESSGILSRLLCEDFGVSSPWPSQDEATPEAAVQG